MDSDFVGDLGKRRSLIGYMFTTGRYAISWKATLYNTLALFIIEAKYMAITEVCKEAIWSRGLLCEISEDLQMSMVFGDSQSVIFSHKISDV